jgi:hypothetical protein
MWGPISLIRQIGGEAQVDIEVMTRVRVKNGFFLVIVGSKGSEQKWL